MDVTSAASADTQRRQVEAQQRAAAQPSAQPAGEAGAGTGAAASPEARQATQAQALERASDTNEARGRAGSQLLGSPTSPSPSAPALPGAAAPGAAQPGVAARRLSAAQAIEAARSPQGQEALRAAHEHNQQRLSTVPEAIQARSAREHAAEFGRGLKDGVKDTVGGLIETAKLAGRYATNSEFRADVHRGVSELREAMRTPEGRQLVGSALGEGGDKIVAEIARNPAYAAGFVAGSLLTGGPITKAISAASKLGAAGRVIGTATERARELASAHRGKLLAGGAAAAAGTGGAIAAGDNIASDVARTGAQAPFATITSAGLAVRGQSRILAAAGREHVKQEAAARRPPPAHVPPPVLPPVDGSGTWLYAP